MRSIAVAIALSAFVSLAAYAKRELDYSKPWCAEHNGQAEVVLDGGTRADCVTSTHAIEVERAGHWYQAIGQSLWYAFQVNKRAGIVMILGPGDRKYLYRLNSVIDHNDLPIDVWTIRK